VSIPEALARSAAKPAGKRPYFLAPETERVLAITMAAVQELAVARERIDTLERLLEAKGVVARDEIEQQEGEAIAANAGGDLHSHEVADEIAAG